MSIYKIEAEGDTVYLKADNEQAAKDKLTKLFGWVPESLLTITKVSKLPKGEKFLG